ncbi:MAG: formate dehydrogenase subunit alpha [Spirochaetaceae bacterium]
MNSDKRVKIKLDGRELEARAGENLLQTAIEAGIEIPHLCYHRKLSPTGACRLCVVKIEGQRGLTTSCTVAVEEGMEVTAFDEELEEVRRHTLEYLLAEQNEEYDGTYRDEFRELVYRYGLQAPESRRYPKIRHAMESSSIDESSPVLSYDGSKCIRCFRCIKACGEVQGKHVLSFSERGLDSYIVAGFGVWGESECDGCGECVQLCPTGALVEKPHREEIRLDKVERRVNSTCPYCGVGCQIELLVQDGRILRADGVEGISPNDGRLCVKGRFGYDFVHSPDRLTTPLIKRDGVFEEASWEEALELIASRFGEIREKHGPEALAGYSSAKCTNEDTYLFQKFIRIAFGTNNIDYCTRLCHSSTVTAMMKSLGGGAGTNSIEDFAKTDCLFVTGNNMIETHPVTATFVKQGLERGMKLIVCDPRWTPLADYADIRLQPRIGTDVALLNGIIRVIIKEELYDRRFIEEQVEGGMEAFGRLSELVEAYTSELVEEICGVPRDKIEAAARIYAGAETAMIATGMGMSQQTAGTDNVFSLLNMMLISGQIGREHAGIDPPRGQNNVQGVTDVGCSPIVYPGYIPVGDVENRRRISELWNVPLESLPAEPGLSTVEIAQAAYDGKIRGMYIMGENPMLTDPDLTHTGKAFENLDFLVVQDIFPTETTPYADVILPAASFAEKNGSAVNSDRRTIRVRKAVESPGEAREDWKIIVDLAEEMGYDLGSYTEASEIFDEIAEAAPIFGGISYDRIEVEGVQWPCPSRDHPGTSTLFTEGFKTESGKAKLFPVEYREETEQRSEEFPFILNTGRILYQYHTSTMSRRSESLVSYAGESYALIHPEDARGLYIAEGDELRVYNRRGEFTTRARIHDGVRRGEIFVPFHFRESRVNRLTRANELDPQSKIAAFKLSACAVEKR